MERRKSVKPAAPVRPKVTLKTLNEVKVVEDKKRLRSLQQPSKELMALLAFAATLLASPFLYVLISRFGLGNFFPQQRFFTSLQPSVDSSALEVVAELPAPPGGIAVGPSGRKFFTFHPEYHPQTVKLAEIISPTEYVPFPSAEFQDQLISCLALRIDSQQRLWVLDYADHGLRKAPAIYAFNVKKGRKKVGDDLVVSYIFPNTITGFGSMLIDFQVDPSGEYVYIADSSPISGTPGLIIYSVTSAESYRVLSEHPSMYGRSTFIQAPAGSSAVYTLGFGPLGLKLHVRSIALDKKGNRLYYGAQTGDMLYAISTEQLRSYVSKIQATRNATYAQNIRERLDKELAEQVGVVLSEKPVTEGISVDDSGNIWMNAVEHAAVAIAMPMKMPKMKEVPRSKAATDSTRNADGKPRKPPPIIPRTQSHTLTIGKVVQSKDLLRWPAGLGFGSDGLYISSSALYLRYLGKDFNKRGPFYIVRLSSRVLKSNVKPKEGSLALPAAGH